MALFTHVRTLSGTECQIDALREILIASKAPEPHLIWTTGINLIQHLTKRRLLSDGIDAEAFYRLNITTGEITEIEERAVEQWKNKRNNPPPVYHAEDYDEAP